MSNGGGTPIPLSGSQGGARILLDDSSVPGKAIHANPADSGTNIIVQNILIGNPNTNQVSMYVAIQGPGVPTPTSHADMVRIDVPPTAEGSDVRLFYTPFILAPGYTYFISCVLQSGNVPPYLYGYANEFLATGILGYGGLVQRAPVAMADIAVSTWQTVPFDENLLTNPINLVQDAGNNRFSVSAEGNWFVTAYGNFTVTKTGTDRVVYVRFFNETDAVSITTNPWPVNIENQNNGALWSFSTIFEVPAALIGKNIRMEMGDPTATIAGISLAKAGVTLVRISPTV